MGNANPKTDAVWKSDSGFAGCRSAGSKAVTRQEVMAWHRAVACGNGLSVSLVLGGGNAGWRAHCPQNANQRGVFARVPFSALVALGC